MKNALEKKLLSLFTGELTATILFFFLYFFFLKNLRIIAGSIDQLESLYCFFLLEMILIQGTTYWYLKWKRVRKGKSGKLAAFQYKLFHALKFFNAFIILVGILLVVRHWILGIPGVWWPLFLLFFAIGEFVNYYYIRLSYQTPQEWKEWKRTGWRPSILAKELKAYKTYKG